MSQSELRRPMDKYWVFTDGEWVYDVHAYVQDLYDFLVTREGL